MQSALSTNCIRKDIGGRLVLGKRLYNGATLDGSSDMTAIQVRLLKPYQNADTTDPLQDWTDASVISSGADDGVIYYDVSSALAADLGINYQAIWRYTYDSRVFYADMIWHIVLHVFDLTITSEDLDREEPTLANFTHITEAIKNRHIESAFRRIWSKLRALRRFPWLVFNSGDINEALKYLALLKLCRAQAKSGDGNGEVWAWKHDKYAGEFGIMWDEIAFSYADTLEGSPSDNQGAAGQGRAIR